MDGKKRLNVVPDRIIEGKACFTVMNEANVDCLRQRCPHWIQHAKAHNCVHIATLSGPHTLQEIGQIYDLTRMRICQIEKTIFEKIRSAS